MRHKNNIPTNNMPYLVPQLTLTNSPPKEKRAKEDKMGVRQYMDFIITGRLLCADGVLCLYITNNMK